MKIKATTLFGLFILITSVLSAQKTITLNDKFNKIIISPHIEVVFIKGDIPSIALTNTAVSVDDFKYELKDNTLQVYLKGTRTYTRKDKTKIIKTNYPKYKGKLAKIVITYTDGVTIFSIKGEEKVTFESPIAQEKCSLRFYGSSEVLIKDVNVDELIVDIYGDSFLTIEKGTIKRQKLRVYGASTIIAMNVEVKETKLSAYGDGNYQLNTSERLKIDAYGEANIIYKGDATLKKGIVIGDSTIAKVD